jgi:hypothetical protein
VKAVPLTRQREGDFTDNSNRCHTFDEFAAGPFSGHVWPLPFAGVANMREFLMLQSQSVVRWLQFAAREKHVPPPPSTLAALTHAC